MVDKKLSEFDAVSTGGVSYFPVLDENTKNAKIAATKAMPWTNCITDIPQDIKLSLNNGTLTLLAGSKVYIPNGSGVFDVYTVPNDLSITSTVLNNAQGVVYLDSSKTLACLWTGYTFSGSIPPAAEQYELWYDTVNNNVKWTSNTGSTWSGGNSFPIAIVTGTSSGLTSINQVFNGFGYVGSTVFALPGVKGLIPNGINDDGSLKNIPFTVNNVLTTTTLSAYSATIVLGAGWINCSGAYSYNEVSNFNFELYTIDFDCIAGYCEKGTDGRIISFNPKPTFHAVDYSEFKEVKDDMMTLSTTQTISGKKAFAEQVFHYNNVFLKGVITLGQSSGVWGLQTQFQDTNGTRIGRVQPYAVNTSDNFMCMCVNNVAGNQEEGIYVYSNGNTSAPTPNAVTDNSTKIATTQWFNNKIQVVSSLPANPVNGVFYFITD